MASIGGPFGAYGGGWLDALLGYEDSNQYRGNLERSGNNAPSTYFADMYPNPNEQMLNLDNNIFANRYGAAANDSFQQRFGNLPIDNRTLANAPPNLFGPMPGQDAPGQSEGPLPPANAQYTSGPAPARLTVNGGLTPPAPHATAADTGLPTGRVPQQQAPSPQFPDYSSGGNPVIAALQGFGKSKAAIPALINTILGGITGQRQDPEGIALSQQAMQQRARYEAIKELPGATPAIAMAGAMDDKIGQQVLQVPELIQQWRLSGMKVPFDKFVRSKMPLQEVNTGDRVYLVDPANPGSALYGGGPSSPGAPAGASGTPAGAPGSAAAPSGGIPIDVQGVAKRRALGTEQGQAAATVGSAKLQALDSIRQLDKAISHPGLEKSVGGFKGMMPDINFAGDSDAMAFRTIHNQLKSQAFLQAYETLRGGGQISNAEGGKAEAALNRAQTTLDPKEYREALKEFRNIMIRGVQRLESKAGNTPTFGTNTLPLPGTGVINMGDGITIRQRQQ